MDASAWAALAGWCGLCLGIINLVLSGRTRKAAEDSARAAEKSAKEAARVADLSAKSLDHAKWQARMDFAMDFVDLVERDVPKKTELKAIVEIVRRRRYQLIRREFTAEEITTHILQELRLRSGIWETAHSQHGLDILMP